HEEVVGFFLRIGTARSIAGDAAPDERGVPLTQCARAEAEAIGRAGRQVLHEDVRLLDQTLENRPGARMLHVEGDALLRAVGPHEVRREALDRVVIGTRRVARPRALDLDDACAKVGKLARGERPGDDLLERDDRDALERPHVNSRLSPASAAPLSCVLQRSPAATGWASVMTPVVMISPGASGGAP